MEPEQIINEASDQKKKKHNIDWLLVCDVACSLTIALAIIFGSLSISSSINNLDAKTPEAEVVFETTECTTAPDETILPTTEETIHSEKTEPTDVASGTAKPSEPVKEEIDISGTPSTEPSSEEKTDDISQEDIEMLAIVIYQEAGGNKQCDTCRRRVADVVLNRVADPRFPNTIKEVLTQKKQYGRLYWTGIKWPERAKYAVEKAAVERAYRIAEEVLRGEHSELYGKGYIWQAGFKQGKDRIYCCGHYFGR